MWRSLPAEDRVALAGVVFEEHDALPGNAWADAGDRLVRLRAGLERHPHTKPVFAHECAHLVENHDVLVAARPHLTAIIEATADARAADWGYIVPRCVVPQPPTGLSCCTPGGGLIASDSAAGAPPTEPLPQ